MLLKLSYPNKLSGNQIPLGARIIAVCDTFDAMTSKRAYRAAMSAEHAVTTINENVGTQFDPAVVTAFMTVLRRRQSRQQELPRVQVAEREALPAPA